MTRPGQRSGRTTTAALATARSSPWALRGGQSGEDYYIEVKGSSATKTFDYGLQLTLKVTICGDGKKELGEQCDDGNTATGDGCNDLCLYETFTEIEVNDTATAASTNGPFPLDSLWSGAINPIGDVDVYRIDLTTTADLSIETFDGTGPGACAVINPKIELRAADGTTVLAADSDDGVGSCALITAQNDFGARHLYPGTYYVVVQQQSNTALINGYMTVVSPTAVCGDGVVEGFEQCDGTPTCDVNCDLIPLCGDGVVSKGEQCDDGNTGSGDGCSAVCQFEGVISEVEPNDTFAQADGLPKISSTTRVAGAIGGIGDKDTFKVDVAALSVIRFETFENMGADCPTLTTALRLYDSAGVQVKVDTAASGIGSCAALVVWLAPGSYYIQVEETGNNAVIPSYILEVKFEAGVGSEVEPNDTQAQGNAVAGGDVFVFGGHQVDADLDYFAITVPAGKSIRAEVVEGSAAETCESNGVDSYLTLFNAGGTSLVTDNDDGRGFCSMIDGTGNAPRDSGAHGLPGGVYYLQVKGFLTGAGGCLIIIL